MSCHMRTRITRSRFKSKEALFLSLTKFIIGISRQAIVTPFFTVKSVFQMKSVTVSEKSSWMIFVRP